MIQPRIPDVFEYLNRPMRLKGAYGGRGSAKSWSFASTLLNLGGLSPLKILCTREYQSSIKDSVKALLDDSIARMKAESFYTSLNTEIRGANGTQFLFYGLRHDINKIKSLEGVDIFWNEEAHTTSQDSLNKIIPTIRKKGSELWFSYNRELDDEPVHNLRLRPDADFRMINYPDNPYFYDTELVADMEWDKAHNYEKYLHVWMGEPQQQSEAIVFRGKFKVQGFETPADATLYYGGDWGFANDPTTLARCFIQGRKLFIDYEAYGVGVDIEETPQLFDSVPGSRDWKITADCARPETISHMNKHGFKVRPASKGKDSVNEGVKFLQNYEIICHPRCKHTAYELGHYAFKTDRLTGDVLPILLDKDNHIIDALRYALEKVRKQSRFMIA